MRVAFRVDSSLQIGSGHVMRCLTLAEALRVRGAGCRFVCRDHPGHLADFIRERGFRVALLPAEHSSPGVGRTGDGTRALYSRWLGTSMRTDAEQTLAALHGENFDWLVVDHYALDATWESALREVCTRLMVIDDLADRRHDCDLLLDQNLGRTADDYADIAPKTSVFMVGPKYALLRPEFAALREYSLNRRRDARLQTLLISMGGFDPQNATGEVLEALKLCPLPPACRIIVVMGLYAPWLERIKELAGQMPWACEVKVSVRNMAQLMADSDLAIGAAGSTSWERCCLGLPAIIAPLADNQVAASLALQERDAAIAIKHGSVRHQLPSIIKLIIHAARLTDISRNAAAVVGGGGTGRVLASLFRRG